MRMLGWGLTMMVLGLTTPAFGADPAASGTVSGKVAWEGLTEYRGVAVLWENCATGGNLIETLGKPPFSAQLAADGGFSVQAPPGDYCLGVVVKRSEGTVFGPPSKGDLIFLTPGEGGEIFNVTLENERNLELGVHSSAWVFPGK